MRQLLTVLSLTLLGTAPATADYVFVNGTLVTMTVAGTIEADLRVADQRIAAIAPSLETGPDDTVIDLDGGYLMPGLAEMHAHVPAPSQGNQYRDDVLFLWVANGVTTARGMLGHPQHLELRRALAAHEVLGPRLITSGPSFNGNSVSSPSQARQMVREQVAAGYDFLKIHPGMTLEQYDAMADEAARQGIRFAGHVPADVGLPHAIESGQATIDHLDGLIAALAPAGAEGGGFFGASLAGAADLGKLPALLGSMQAAGTWLVPTETLSENVANDVEELLDRPEIAYLPPELKRRYQEAISNARAGAEAARRALVVRKQAIRDAQRAGVGVLLGSDAPQIFNVPGFSAHRELAAMVAAGLSPEEALATGTTAPARYFEREHDFGALAVGLAADLVVLSADPTADIANAETIQGVMVRGRWLDRATLDAGLEAIATRYRSAE